MLTSQRESMGEYLSLSLNFIQTGLASSKDNEALAGALLILNILVSSNAVPVAELLTSMNNKDVSITQIIHGVLARRQSRNASIKVGQCSISPL